MTLRADFPEKGENWVNVLPNNPWTNFCWRLTDWETRNQIKMKQYWVTITE